MLVGYSAKRVTYFDEDTYDGTVGPFRKSSRFEYEKEWRLAVQQAEVNPLPLRIDIGAIEDISELVDSNTFKNHVVRLPNGSIELDW